jgi:hypothetical protein
VDAAPLRAHVCAGDLVWWSGRERGVLFSAVIPKTQLLRASYSDAGYKNRVLHRQTKLQFKKKNHERQIMCSVRHLIIAYMNKWSDFVQNAP